MGRNLFKRIEVAFPVRDAALKRRVVEEGLLRYLGDNRDAWALLPDGQWTKRRIRRSTKAKSAQSGLLELLAAPRAESPREQRETKRQKPARGRRSR
jgi:polyphosphate kinase